MKIYYVWNEHHKELLENFFLSSLLEFNEKFLNPVGIKIDEPGEGVKFGTETFQKMTTEKAKNILNICKMEKEPFIVSDVDVQFFGPIDGEISRALSTKKEITFQKESNIHGVNTGFMLIVPNQKVMSFWERVVLDLVSSDNHRINDQHVTNRLLGRSGLEFGVFGPRIWAYSQGGPHEKILVHHANCTTTLEAKIRQLKRIKRLVRSSVSRP